jgi:hypothetical protein
MFKNFFSRQTAWILKWIETNINFGSILGRAKRRKLEKEEKQLEYLRQQKRPFVESNADKERRVRERKQIYSVQELVESLPTGKNQQYYWERLVETLQDLGRTGETLEVGKYYTFKYWAKTKGKYFDVYPVSIIVKKDMHTILGVNLHWKNAPNYVESMYRSYIYSGFQSMFYEIKEWELEYVMRLPTFLPVKL